MSKHPQEIKIVFFGTSRVSKIVLEELEKEGYTPELAPDDLNIDTLKEKNADVFVVAAYGKILPKEILEIPKFGSINIHPSLLPKMRGSSPIQNTILTASQPGVTIIKMDAEVDHGPVIAQEKLSISPFPDQYAVVEEKLARAGGKLLAEILPKWMAGEMESKEQDHSEATFVKMIEKKDGELNLNDDPEMNLRKVYAYSTWPGAHFFFETKNGKRMRIVVKDAEIKDGQFLPTKVIPEGKKEMPWDSYIRGNA